MYRFIRKGEFPRNMDGQTKTEGQGIPGFISTCICSSIKVNFREIWTDRQSQGDRVIPVYNSSQKLGSQGENDGVFYPKGDEIPYNHARNNFRTKLAESKSVQISEVPLQLKALHTNNLNCRYRVHDLSKMYQNNIKLFHSDITSCIELDSYNRNNFPAIDNTGIMGEFNFRIFCIIILFPLK